jgi:hypothetical protein
MSKVIRSILIASLAATGMILSPSQPSASAASCVGIYRIYYNSPGTDTGSNTSLNAEWIQLHNRCSTSRSLTNAKIKDAAGHTYNLRVLRAGRRQVRQGPHRQGEQHHDQPVPGTILVCLEQRQGHGLPL